MTNENWPVTNYHLSFPCTSVTVRSRVRRSKTISRVYAEFEAVPEYWIVLRFSARRAFAVLRRRVLACCATAAGGFSHKKAQRAQKWKIQAFEFCVFLWPIPNKT